MISFYGLAISLAAIWVWSDVTRRNGSGRFFWTLGTLVIPFLFLPLYLYQVYNSKQPLKTHESEIIDVEARPIEEHFPCPSCRQKVYESYTLCPYCGYTLHTACRSCGQRIRIDWNTCPYCGQSTK